MHHQRPGDVHPEKHCDTAESLVRPSVFVSYSLKVEDSILKAQRWLKVAHLFDTPLGSSLHGLRA